MWTRIWCPTLCPGDIVIMDHLGCHKRKAVRDVARSAGARLWYPPPYSSDRNPIEQSFAKIKHWVRMAQKRSIEDTWHQVGRPLPTINANECANDFKNAGCEPT